MAASALAAPPMWAESDRDRLTTEEALATCLAVRDRGVEWLVERVSPDGAPAGGVPFRGARIPYSLALAGRADVAASVVDWYAREGVGALLPPDGQGYAGYFLPLFLLGASAVTRYDVVDEFRAELTARLAPVGAPWSTTDPGCGIVELVPACQAGITFLALGDVARARRIAELLRDAWEEQPDPEERLFMVTTGDGRLLSEVPAGVDPRPWAVERTAALQHFYFGAIAAAFLTQAAWRTGEGEYLATAQRYFRFATRQPRQFETHQVCKSAWGAAYLFVATRDETTLEWLVEMAAWFDATQRADGSWRDPNSPEEESRLMAITAEFVQHLTVMTWALGQVR